MLDRWLTQEAVVTVRVPDGEVDRYGNATVTTTDVPAMVWTHPLNADEFEDRPAGRLTHRGYINPDTDAGFAIDAGCKVTLASGQTFEVDGPPLLYQHPRIPDRRYYALQLVEVV